MGNELNSLFGGGPSAKGRSRLNLHPGPKADRAVNDLYSRLAEQFIARGMEPPRHALRTVLFESVSSAWRSRVDCRGGDAVEVNWAWLAPERLELTISEPDSRCAACLKSSSNETDCLPDQCSRSLYLLRNLAEEADWRADEAGFRVRVVLSGQPLDLDEESLPEVGRRGIF